MFCNFGSAVKILPAVFAVWMRILHQVPNSVLWILNYRLDGEDTAIANLRQRARTLGIASNRIVTTGLLWRSQMFKLKSLCRVYLDTDPYNGHTTVAEALYASIPVVTLLGESVVGRIAAGIVMAAGIPETVVNTWAAYESTAVALARNSTFLSQLRRRLTTNIWATPTPTSAPFFNPALWVQHWEQLLFDTFYTAWQQRDRGN